MSFAKQLDFLVLIGLVLAFALIVFAYTTKPTDVGGTHKVQKIEQMIISPQTWVPSNWCQTGEFFVRVKLAKSAPSAAFLGPNNNFYITLGPLPRQVNIYVSYNEVKKLQPVLLSVLYKYPEGYWLNRNSCDNISTGIAGEF